MLSSLFKSIVDLPHQQFAQKKKKKSCQQQLFFKFMHLQQQLNAFQVLALNCSLFELSQHS